MKTRNALFALGFSISLTALLLGSFLTDSILPRWATWSGNARAANPCSPRSTSAANPCSPGSSKGVNPCNPCAPKAANPCAPKAANPCNPCAPKAANPCNPCSPKAAAQAVSLVEWGRDYSVYQRTTGFVESASHGGRLVVTFVAPKSAADAYRVNAKLVRDKQSQGFKLFPAGTVIVKESFVKDGKGGPGQRGPVFFMRKEKAGYDPEGGNWRYAFTQPDFTLIAEGKTGDVAFCRSCHLAVKARDFVYAVDR